MLPTITRPVRAKLERPELQERTDRRAPHRERLAAPPPAAITIALALCKVEAGNRSAAQLERFFHYTLWAAASSRIRRGGARS
jgi:hypothetical protein